MALNPHGLCSVLLLVLLQSWLKIALTRVPASFVSIDCGSNSTRSYIDASLPHIQWTPDSNLINVGEIAQIPQSPAGDDSARYKTIRYFPELNQTKFCYLLSAEVSSGASYLVRASFWLGSGAIFQTQNSSSVNFKLLIDADYWADILVPQPQSDVLVEEVYVHAQRNSIALCLSGAITGSDIPFISSIELRPLESTLTPIANSQEALRLVARLDYGTQPNISPVRFPDDNMDRIWKPNPTQPTVNTTHSIYNNAPDLPPVLVLQTSYESPVSSFTVNITVYPGLHSYFYALYFSEIDPRVNRSGQRVFDVTLNGESILSQEDVYKDDQGKYGYFEFFSNYSYSTSLGYMLFNFTQAPSSIYPPFIAAIELLAYFDNPMSEGTFDADFAAVEHITARLANLNSFTGDPCLPSGYGYPWLTCSSAARPQITALSLSNYGLVGQIPLGINNLTGLVTILLDRNMLEGQLPDLSVLTSLRVLNLSDNRLTGPIPDGFSSLQNLEYLNLERNNLSGPIPTLLLQNANLVFEYAGNPFLCTSNISCITTSSQSGKSSHITLIIGVVIVVPVALLFLGSLAYFIPKKRRLEKQKMETTKRSHGQQHVIRQTELIEASNLAQVFSYRDLEVATNNFSTKLGEGGFGPVYRGRLPNGSIIAIKMLSNDSRQGAQEFLNEVALLSRVHHKNLVTLLGYCNEEKLGLVYEYMSKGSLSQSLYGKTTLPWIMRLKIMSDAAQGLEYLHHGCNPHIIHRDVKCSNILLNDQMEAKIADFGISRFRVNDTINTTTTFMGTLGYMDPEYASNSLRLTTNVDVYSFGVLLLEVISGQYPIIQKHSKHDVHIVDWARPWIERGMIENVVDSTLGMEYNVSSMWKVIEIAMMCVEFDTAKRPTMSEVCMELKEAMHMEFESDQWTANNRMSDEFAQDIALMHVGAR